MRDLGAQAYDPVVGRFAFMMYDQGGLLDLNVAGFAPALSGEDPAGIERGFKGGVAFADVGVLAQAFGLSSAESAAWTNRLLQWRNPGSYVAAGTSDAALRLRDFILGEKFGFLAWRPVGDRAFPGRRGLIDFVRHALPDQKTVADELIQRVTHQLKKLLNYF